MEILKHSRLGSALSQVVRHCKFFKRNRYRQDGNVIYLYRTSFRALCMRYLDDRRIIASAVCLLTAICLINAIIFPDQQPAGTIIVKVKAGDNLWKYAKKYGDHNEYILKRVYDIAAVNDIDPGKPLLPGQELIIPIDEDTRQAKLPDVQ